MRVILSPHLLVDTIGMALGEWGTLHNKYMNIHSRRKGMALTCCGNSDERLPIVSEVANTMTYLPNQGIGFA